MEKYEIRKKWKDHDLFKKTFKDLLSECKDQKLPVTNLFSKTDLFERLAKSKNIQEPTLKDQYTGNLCPSRNKQSDKSKPFPVKKYT